MLHHVFFAENTVHLLVWHESDGLSGLDSIEDRFQLIRVSTILRVYNRKGSTVDCDLPYRYREARNLFGQY